jgi:hypothetical protein
VLGLGAVHFAMSDVPNLVVRLSIACFMLLTTISFKVSTTPGVVISSKYLLPSFILWAKKIYECRTMNAEYLIFNFIVISGPLSLSFDRKVHFVDKWFNVFKSR